MNEKKTREKLRIDQEHFNREKQRLNKLQAEHNSGSEDEDDEYSPLPQKSKKTVEQDDGPFECPGCYNCNWTGYTTDQPDRCKLYR